jgi:hypothetical protein
MAALQEAQAACTECYARFPGTAYEVGAAFEGYVLSEGPAWCSRPDNG